MTGQNRKEVNMKKYLAMILAASMALSLAACGGNAASSAASEAAEAVESAEAEAENPQEAAAVPAGHADPQTPPLQAAEKRP